MAKILLSPLIVDIRNKQSDTVFSKWKGVNYIRSRIVPSNPKTAAQIAIRNALSRMVALWQASPGDMTDNQDEWAKGKNLSGFNRWIQLNTVDEKDDALLTVTQEVGFTKLTAFSANNGGAGAGEMNIVWTPTPVPADTTLEVYFRLTTSETWNLFQSFPAATASPQTVAGLTAATEYQVYGFLADDSLPLTGDKVGKDRSQKQVTG